MRAFLARCNRSRLLATLFLGAVLLMGASDDSSRMDRLGHRMMCMCSCGQILMECNHVGCTYSDTMRHELSAGIDSGKSDKEILASFVEKYGTTVLAAPTHSGFDRVAWLMPYILFVVGIGGCVVIVRTWHRRHAPAAAAVTSGLSPDELRRLREQARKETDL